MAIPINIPSARQLWGRLGERTKLIGIGALAFLLGSFWGGRGITDAGGGSGRYVTCTIGDEHGVLDTRNGQIWLIDNTSHKYKRGPSLPYF